MAGCAGSCGCSCEDGENRVIFACAGVSNVGQLANRTLLKAGELKVATPSCLAGMGADLPGFVIAAKDADKSIVIDGCPVRCGEKIFKRHGLEPTVHVVLTQHGFEKGETQFSDDDGVLRVIEIVKASLLKAGGKPQ